ncbi:LysM peptidoglycan-binding domain-containing protein [Proteiniborus sp. MB09-C3]|uniref:LysM peptidoglycan-binding domain-containing protein n=1 Tax=Proteiniborus sp. MB09-C3 TaxID=3050072 RepID=UPI0025535871|nr:LysM peptidoglycan-binding domain-containing protein [Proteiniborus sp. MB09-C3]WIV11013.1 LysM peptidoglycan-binding domain-containing protein [Proteiniborus sp. MB09-C3]
MEAKIATKNLMKKKINLSKKERSLLILLLIVILFWLFYKLAFTKQAIRIAELKQEKNSYNEELLKIDTILSRDKAIADEWAKLDNDIRGVQSKYFSTIDQPEIMHMLNDIVDNNNLKVPGMYFNGPDYAMLGSIETKYLGISIPFEGDYDELGTFFSLLRSSPKRFLVNQLAISKGNEGKLNGQISLNTYSYDEIIDSESGSTYNAGVQKVIKEDPFKPYEGYVIESEEDIYDDGETGIIEESEKRTILEDFEDDNIYFMSTSSDVTGKVYRFNSSKHGKYSLRTEYFISTVDKEERAYVVLDDKDIYLKYPPSSIGVWAHSYGYSPVILGFRFQDQEGNKIDLEIARGINWMGWEFVETMPPQDINLYPLKLDRVYLELGANRDDYGVILFDNIETEYPLMDNEEEKQDKAYSFYLVQYGDTLESISEKIYGTKSKYKEIMNQNGLSQNTVLEAGQILVVPK